MGQVAAKQDQVTVSKGPDAVTDIAASRPSLHIGELKLGVIMPIKGKGGSHM
jgi:hypothetical protein